MLLLKCSRHHYLFILKMPPPLILETSRAHLITKTEEVVYMLLPWADDFALHGNLRSVFPSILSIDQKVWFKRVWMARWGQIVDRLMQQQFPVILKILFFPHKVAATGKYVVKNVVICACGRHFRLRSQIV